MIWAVAPLPPHAAAAIREMRARPNTTTMRGPRRAVPIPILRAPLPLHIDYPPPARTGQSCHESTRRTRRRREPAGRGPLAPGPIARQPGLRTRPTYSQMQLTGEAGGDRLAFYCAARDAAALVIGGHRSEEHTSDLQSRQYLVCRLL